MNLASFLVGSGGSLYTYIVNGSMILNGVGIVFGKGSLRLGSRILARCKNNINETSQIILIVRPPSIYIGNMPNDELRLKQKHA